MNIVKKTLLYKQKYSIIARFEEERLFYERITEMKIEKKKIDSIVSWNFRF